MKMIYFSGFFENLAFESKIEAEKTLMIKSSIHHRKSCVRRAHTFRYDAARKRKLKDRGLHFCCIPNHDYFVYH